MENKSNRKYSLAQVIKLDSRILSNPIRNRWKFRRNSYDSACGITNGSIVLESERIRKSDPIGSDSWVKLHSIVLVKWIGIKWGVIRILPSYPLIILQSGFGSDFVGWSDPIRSDRARYRIHWPGYNLDFFY